MRLFDWIWRGRHQEDREAEMRARAERLAAERKLRETTERWRTVNEAADAVAELRRSDRDPFVDELADAMKPRPRHRGREA